MIKVIVDKETNGHWIAPFLIDYTQDEEKRIDRLWKWSGHSYIVDPLGYDQCLALEYDELPIFFKCLFNVRELHITYEEYKNNIY